MLNGNAKSEMSKEKERVESEKRTDEIKII